MKVLKIVTGGLACCLVLVVTVGVAQANLILALILPAKAWWIYRP